MAPNHLRIDASVITSFTCGFDQEHIYQTANHHLQPNFTTRDSQNAIKENIYSYKGKTSMDTTNAFNA